MFILAVVLVAAFGEYIILCDCLDVISATMTSRIIASILVLVQNKRKTLHSFQQLDLPLRLAQGYLLVCSWTNKDPRRLPYSAVSHV